MTETMRTRVEKAIEKGMTIEAARAAIESNEKVIAYWNSLPSWRVGFTGQSKIASAKAEIEFYTAVIEVLTEKAATEAVAETVAVLAAIVTVANKAKAVRKAVTTLANKLRRIGFTLSDAFKRSWTLIKAFNGLLPGTA